MLRLPMPRHLNDILVMNCQDHNEFNISGHIECTCNNKNLIIKYVGDEVNHGTLLQTTCSFNPINGQNDYYLQLIAYCPICLQSHLVFDNRSHGWDGYIKDQTTVKDISQLSKTKTCEKCQCKEHLIELDISNLGIEDFKLNGPEKPIEDWTEGFEWITVHIKCIQCAEYTTKWVNLECL
ncbi:MAG: hypothetical protein IT245_00465 [Bacteroidia bacterium]|nr:hypothetical protein [Bacteroidia bacterium]